MEDKVVSLALRRSPTVRLEGMIRAVERRRVNGEDVPDVLISAVEDAHSELERRRREAGR